MCIYTVALCIQYDDKAFESLNPNHQTGPKKEEIAACPLEQGQNDVDLF